MSSIKILTLALSGAAADTEAPKTMANRIQLQGEEAKPGVGDHSFGGAVGFDPANYPVIKPYINLAYEHSHGNSMNIHGDPNIAQARAQGYRPPNLKPPNNAISDELAFGEMTMKGPYTNRKRSHAFMKNAMDGPFEWTREDMQAAWDKAHPKQAEKNAKKKAEELEKQQKRQEKAEEHEKKHNLKHEIKKKMNTFKLQSHLQEGESADKVDENVYHWNALGKMNDGLLNSPMGALTGEATFHIPADAGQFREVQHPAGAAFLQKPAKKTAASKKEKTVDKVKKVAENKS
jgi:hypothetical protein